MKKHSFFCIDAHTCGNPVRVVAGGAPPLQGASMSEKRQHFLREFDWIRTGLMYEPRGHDMMSGSIPYPPTRNDCDSAILFIETSGCLPMCGHGTIGTVTVLLEEGLVNPKNNGVLKLETPAGRVDAYYKIKNGHVVSVKFVNIPCYLHSAELTVDCPEIGEIVFDVAYGGNFYAIVEPQKNYPGLKDWPAANIIRYSPLLRRAINEKYSFVHPEDSTIQGLSHIQWTGKPTQPGADARNAVFYGQKAIDRSPCGTGTSARMAQLHARGKLKVGDSFVHESIIGSLFTGRVESTAQIGNKTGIIPSIEGWASITGYNTIFLDERDPFVRGFQVL